MVENRISEMLGKQRKTIRDLSKEAGIAYATAHGLFHGKTRMVSFEVVEKLCDYFKCDVGDIFYIKREES